MGNPIDSLKQLVSSRTRAEWRAWAVEQWNDLWGWIEGNGGSSFFIGMVVMLCLLLAFRLVAILLVLVCAAAGAAYYMAPEARVGGSEPRESGDIQH